jgi:hypothetical protein
MLTSMNLTFNLLVEKPVMKQSVFQIKFVLVLEAYQLTLEL